VLRRRRLRAHRHRRGGRLPRDHALRPPHRPRGDRRLRPLPPLRRAQASSGPVLRPRSALEEWRRRGTRRPIRGCLGLGRNLGHPDRRIALRADMTATASSAPPIVEFVVTGDEVMRGTIADTNTAWTAARLYPLGFQLRRTVVVGDRGEDIRRALLEASVRADFCIVSGGLGPTSDDLTAECAAQAAGVGRRLDEAWLQRMRERWAARRREPMPKNNERQAYLPEGAEMLGNPDGSAPAFALRIDRCTFFFLPGVPREYQRILNELVLPRLARATGNAALRTRVLQCYGVTESRLDEIVDPIRAAHPEVRFGFRTTFAENHLSLAALDADDAAAARALATVEAKCREALAGFVYGADGVTFAQSVGEAVAARGETLCCAESCTGGLATQLLTEV